MIVPCTQTVSSRLKMPRNREHDLVQVPFVATARVAATQFIGVGLPKCEAPLPHGFIRHDDASLGEKLFDVAKTQRKTKIQPHRMADNDWWEAIAFVIR